MLVTSDDSGLIETVKNSMSIHSIKKEAYTRKWNEEGSAFTLKDYYLRVTRCMRCPLILIVSIEVGTRRE